MRNKTICDAIKYGNNHLSKIFSNYKNETLWILQKVLNEDLTFITLNKNQIISHENYALYINLIKRREHSEPIQHILESVDFYGYKFIVDENVFIPRPETELMIDIVKKQIGKAERVLEIGTGTGCIGLSLELEKVTNYFESIDINNDAIRLAKKNAILHGCNKITFKNENIFQFIPKIKYDLIISNPPYISIKEIPALETEVSLYDPLNSLTDFKDGLTFYRFFNDFGKSHLKKGGFMLFELGQDSQVNELKKIFSHNVYNYKFIKDLNGKERFILLNKK